MSQARRGLLLQVHTTSWNEGQRLVEFVRRYRDQASRVVVHDAGSDDGSPQAAAAVGATVLPLGDQRGSEAISLARSTRWRATACPRCWVLLADVDELIEARGASLAEAAARCAQLGRLVVRAEGWEATQLDPLRGRREPWNDKVCLFSAAEVLDLRLAAHPTEAAPQSRSGRALPVDDCAVPLRLVHLKLCRPPGEVAARARAMLDRHGDADGPRGHGFHQRRFAEDAAGEAARAAAGAVEMEAWAR